MAHRPTQRRNPAAPLQYNPSSSTVTAPAKAKNTTTATAGSAAVPFPYPKPNPDLIAQLSRPNNHSSFMAKQFSSLNLGPNTHKTKQHALSHAKSMTSSCIVDSSSKLSLLKPITASSNNKLAPKVEKEGAKRSSLEKKPQKSKLHGLLAMKNENEKRKKKSSVVEKSKNPVEEEEEEGHGDGDKRRSCVVSSVSSGRRRSMCGPSEAELGDVFAINGVKLVSADMPPFMQIHAVDCARKTLDSMEKFTSKTLALSLKKEFDGVYGPAWHCIVGTSFGSYVTHSVGGFLYFSMDQKLYILLFKTAVQKVN
ncbi:hypothetical protein HN51_001799 [Arachis hypogaea]|uniref:Dynein light chain n=2 Tax=Arachis TaxID=3817 RepID=A0A445EQ11_ARAHY|nr:uncharacterized protein LOC107493427 [Arachis duranensis]XP_025603122.1 uncharacterized protein LOC112695123 [Arachis hypogaea]QHO49905.1 Dynein light chain LC6, flagellar outer arm [Arachis hypogaea]RYR77564.1 hypothetical protein Ahy_A01g002080 [Arachis hypogaea]